MNIKKAAAVILSVTIALGMVSCKGDKEESSKSESKSNNGNVNTESVSESSSTSANEESIADSVESKTESEDESKGTSDGNKDMEYRISSSFYGENGEWQYELSHRYFWYDRSAEYGFSYQENFCSKENPVFFEICGIHNKKNEIEFDLNDSTEWLTNCHMPIVETLISTYPYQYDLEESKESLVFENQKEVQINGIKFIKFDGYFTDNELGRVNLVGYITVTQCDGDDIFNEPDVIGFMATLQDGSEGTDKYDEPIKQELLEEVTTHAAETLTFTE